MCFKISLLVRIVIYGHPFVLPLATQSSLDLDLELKLGARPVLQAALPSVALHSVTKSRFTIPRESPPRTFSLRLLRSSSSLKQSNAMQCPSHNYIATGGIISETMIVTMMMMTMVII